MRKLLATFLRLMVLGSVLLAPLPMSAGVVSQFSDTVSVHTSSVAANHTVTFVTPTGVESSTDTLLLTFVTGFSLASLSAPLDFDLAVGNTGVCSTATFTDKTLASAAAAGVWGVAVSGQQVTFTAPTDAAAGEITAGRCVQIQIGTHATFGGTGTNRIVNPATTGSKTVWLSGTFADSGETAIAITSPGQVTVGATVTGGSSGGGGGSVIIASPPPDLTPPIISNVHVATLGNTSAEIAWDTNELANSTVEYGLTLGYELGTVTSGSLVFLRQLAIGGLSQGTTYHYRVTSADGVGNSSTSSDYTFTTTIGPDTEAPVISGVNVTNITGTSATVGWTTNEDANSEVRFGLTPAYGTIVTDSSMTTTHYIDLKDLTPNTLYYYRAYSTDGVGNIGQSAGGSFTTLDTLAPQIQNFTVDQITDSSAVVTFTTDEDVNVYVEYGLSDTAYTQQLPAQQGTAFSFTLTGLNPNTLYYVHAVATDTAGNMGEADSKFVTLPDVVPPPAVTGFTVTPGDRQNQLNWTNPGVPDFSAVRVLRKISGFPTDSNDGFVVYVGGGNSFLNTGLTNDIRYYYGVFPLDTRGNIGTGALADGMPVGQIIAPACGNGVCDVSESAQLCPIDCLVVPVVPVCGNGMCEMGESQQSCAVDCSIGQVENRDLNTFTGSDVQVIVRNRGVQIVPSAAGVFDVVLGSEVLVAIPDRFIAGPVTSAILTIGQERYTMFKGGSYDAFVQLPNTIGSLPATVQLTYADGNFDSANFTLNVVGSGLVYTMSDTGQQAVSGATITLYKYTPGQQTAQVAVSDANGSFVFVVSPGEYSLKVEKVGFAPRETPKAYVQAVVNNQVELMKVTPIEEILQTDAPIVDKAQALLDEANIRVQIFKSSPLVQAQADVAAPLAASVATANAIAITTVAVAANAGAWFQYLFLQPLLWFSRRKRKGWGIVYDSLTKLPVDLAVVRLLDAASGRVMQSRVTDRQGRYFFILDPGRYRLQVTKPGYVFPSKYMEGKKEDVQYTEIYHAEELTVTDTGATLAANIPLDPMDKVLIPAKSVLLKAAWRKFQVGLSWVSVVAGVVAAYLHPTTTTIGLLILQLVLLVVFQLIAKGKKPKGWGIVYDGATKQPLSNAVVRIFEPTYNKLLDTYVTDSRGRYAFIVGPNTYYTTYEHAGYSPHRLDGLDYSKAGESAVVDKNVELLRTTPGAGQILVK